MMDSVLIMGSFPFRLVVVRSIDDEPEHVAVTAVNVDHIATSHDGRVFAKRMTSVRFVGFVMLARTLGVGNQV